MEGYTAKVSTRLPSQLEKTQENSRAEAQDLKGERINRRSSFVVFHGS